MVNLVVIRHGETKSETEKRTLGWIDEPLTREGAEAAHEFARGLLTGGGHHDLIITSPLLRALQTAAKISSVLGIPVEQEALIKERNFGELSGLTWEEFVKKYPKLAERNQPQYQPDLPHGESIEAVTARVKQFLNKIKTSHLGDRVIVVTHSGVIRIILRLAQGLTPEQIRELEIPNLAVFEIPLTAAIPGGSP